MILIEIQTINLTIGQIIEHGYGLPTQLVGSMRNTDRYLMLELFSGKAFHLIRE
jgi:uncharacterized protein YlaN (UPF0358 family)